MAWSFGVGDSEFGVQGLGLRDLGFGTVRGLGFRVEVWVSGIWGLGFVVWGVGFGVWR